MGVLDPATIAFFKALDRPISQAYMPELDPTFLFPTRNAARQMNAARLRQLSGPSFVFNAIDDRHPAVSKKMVFDFPVATQILLKVGAQVMLVQNIGSGLANGSTGTVVGFYKSEQVDPHSPRRKAGYIRGVRVDCNNFPVECQYGSIEEMRDTRHCFPLIKFSTPDGLECVLIMPVEFSHKHNDKTLARRFQVCVVRNIT